jgi:DNA-binding NarL/FixJ family response regulator
MVNSFKPDIVFMEIDGEDNNYMDIIPLFTAKSPGTRTIVLSVFTDEDHIRQALANQISGYLLKDSGHEIIAESIRTIFRGGVFFDPRIVSKAIRLISKIFKKENQGRYFPLREKKLIPPTLSGIELRIMTYVGEGRSDKEIAENLGLKPGTVRNYISSAIRKAGLRNRTEIAIYALKQGLASPP